MEEDLDDERRTNFWRLHVGYEATGRGSLMKGRRNDRCGKSGICRKGALRACALNEDYPGPSTA